ncbi:MAG: carotenoid oxygenase family protein [Brasilonema octagenarum HA4186-MV1]|jgi:carotenoid cleavage dioxygenase-like enzyme|nr:carotenoid oxygenase family protein [Brasilonema octagenarum HA4186-MV1]
MQTINKKSRKKAWAQALAEPAKEFSLTQLQILSGTIPEGLHGTLYRNGPARLERGGMRMGHWFDGDGAILAVHFNSPYEEGEKQGATAVYRYVQTDGYKEEAAAGQLLYGNYGMTAPGAFWNRWLKPVKNSANTSVLALPDKLLALWEGDNPHALDLQMLNTLGKDDLGALKNGLPYSAHPKIDQKSGSIFNFGISVGLNGILNIYKSDFTGKIQQKTSFELDGLPLIHDFVLAGQYLVFFAPAVRLNMLPVLTGFSCYSNSLEWKPQLGTQVLVFDCETLSLVSRGETEPWFQWHFGNGYVDDSGLIVVDVVRYADFQTNEYLRQVATGETDTSAVSTLWRIHIEPSTAKVKGIEEIIDRHCEFPVVPPQDEGQYTNQTYLVVHRQGACASKEIFGAIARFDHKTDILTIADCGENRYPSEPIYAQNPQNPEQGWIITVVYDGNSDCSEVWVYDADRLDDSPVCRLALPGVIPHSFHGTWKSAHDYL